MEKNDKAELDMDARLVDGIGRGDARSWEEFVGRFTGWTLYRAARWCEKHCPHRHSGMECGIKSVSSRMAENDENGRRAIRRSGADECDEGMDTYIWIMEQLRKRIVRYGGRSRLSTFVWAVLNSRELYVDWLRWKYGRVF